MTTMDRLKRLQELSPADRDSMLKALSERASKSVAAARIPRAPREQFLPLSFAQQRLWFIDQLEPGTSVYNIPLAIKLTGVLNADALERAINEIVRRHEALRTTFDATDGQAAQVIHPYLPVPLTIMSLEHLPLSNRETEARRLAQLEAGRPFDLSVGPLIRTTLLRLGEREHVVLLTVHHIISDDWSSGLLIKEVAALYEAYSAGRPTPLAELAIQYADFAIWQRNWLKGDVVEKQLAYWREQLANLPALQLPKDYPRPVAQSYRGATADFLLPAGVARSLQDLSQREGSTLFMTLLAAWQLLLARYSGQEDIVAGSPIAGRNRAETETLIGFFVNTLVLRTDISGNPSFRELLRRVREMSLAAYGHQDIPFEQLVEEVAPARDLSRHPLFQVVFVLENAAREAESIRDLTLSHFAGEYRSAKFDLTLNIAEMSEGLSGTIEYATDLFEPATIARMAGHIQNLLTRISETPEARIGDLAFLSDAESRQLLTEFNGARSVYPVDACVHQIFERQAAATPQSVALVFENQKLTYSALNARANQLAHYLQMQGVGPDVRVGLLVERSLEMVVGLLGILKAGGAYVPLDVEYPADRRAFMLEDANAPVLVTQKKLAANVSQDAVHIVYLDSDWDRIALQSRENPVSHVCPQNTAYVIYTSGSTGKPKGSLIPHTNIIRLFEATQQHFRFGPEDAWTLFHSIAFDFSVWEVWGPLLHGGELHIVPYLVSRTPSDFWRMLVERKVTVLNQTPSAFRQLQQVALEHPEDALALRVVIFGGEALDLSSLSAWYEQPNTAKATLVNMYGITETTVHVTYRALTAEDVVEGAGSLIGTAIDDLSLTILDQYGQLTPIGVPGELYVGGPGLARGYLNRPGLTAERFVPHPFSSISGERLYRTGDLVRWLAGGELEYLGRVDAQVKIRGFRIELGEIEATLSQHPDISAAVVVAQEDNAGHSRLVAYAVAKVEQLIPVSDLRSFLKTRLPEYMVPATFVFLDTLPLTPNGKIDRKALPMPRAELADDYAAPRTDIEETLAGLWASVLGRERVGVDDNFFEIGGDSILSIQIVARANQAGIALTPKLMFQHQTIAELASVCGTGVAIQAEQGLVTGPIPLTPIQHWFFNQGMAAPHHYNQSVLLQTEPHLTPDILRRAVQQLTKHHDALRIRFTPTPEGWLQDNHSTEGDDSSCFSVADLSHLEGIAQRDALEQAAEQLQARLDLEAGPLFAVRHFTLGLDQPGRLLVVAHHLVIDGVSWRILLEDLQLACTQLLEGTIVAPPAKTTSFQRWSEQLQEYAQSARIKPEKQYWAALPWAGAKPLPIDPAFEGDDPSRFNTLETARTITEALSAELTSALLHEAPEAYHTQINDILLAALAATLGRWTGDNHVLLTLEGHGREDLFESTDVSRTIGWFTSLFPVFLHWTPQTQPGVLLIETKEMLRGIPERGIGYGLLRYLSATSALPSAREAAEYERAAMPEPEVSFNYLGQFDQTLPEGGILQLAPENAGSAQSLRNRRAHVLEINAMIAGGQLRVNWTYSGRLHADATIQALASDYVQQLQALITHCLSPGAGTFTPSDFPDANLSLPQLTRIIGELGDAVPDAVYPLSPMQQGMLFHALVSPGSGEYVTQTLIDLHGGLDAAAFQEAWRQVIARHDILRTAFFWEGLAEPVQVVCRSTDTGQAGPATYGACLSVEQRDWSHLSDDERESRFEQLVKQDAEDGYKLSRAPLMRLVLVHMSERDSRLLWSHHHLLLDGWCLPVVYGEVIAFYHAALEGRRHRAERPRPYREYIRWLRKQDMAGAEAYWRHTLSGFAAPTPLPAAGISASGTDRNAPSVDQNGELSFSLPRDLSELAGAFAQRHQITLNTLMQGVWSLILSQYSGQNDVLFGATVSGRPPALPGIETMLGLFINTLPVRVRVSAGQSVTSWLQEMQSAQGERSEYEFSPLTSVHRWSGVPNSLPLFESLLVFENYPVERGLAEQIGAAGGPRIENVDVRERSNYPLGITVNPGDRIVLRFSYHRMRYADEAIERLAGHWRTLLSQIAVSSVSTATALRIGELSLLSDTERHQFLIECNDTRVEYPVGVCVHDLFERQAAQTPNALAVAFEHQSLSYSELNARANQLAHALRRRGIGPDMLVALCMPRSLEMIVGILGTLKAGGVYLPLDPAYPPERLAFMLLDADPPLLLTDQRILANLPANRARALSLDTQSFANESAENLGVEVLPGNLAYMIYTSGSTGTPKGALLTHEGLANVCAAQQRLLGVGPDDKVLQFASPSFDSSVFEIVLALASGASLQLISSNTAAIGQPLADLLKSNGVTTVVLTPSVLQTVSPDDLPRLTKVFVAGEACPPALTARWSHGRRFRNLYGPTETTIWATQAQCRGDEEQVSIGKAISNTQAYILSAGMQCMPHGARGELYLGGVGLARGYRNRPELTAEKFIPNPFSDTPGERLYRTGDLCRYLPDGNIEFLGRADTQVKIRGFRIELGEIEAALAQHADVALAVAVAHEDGPGRKRLVAYAAAKAGRRIDISELRATLKTRLPEHMVPSAFIVLDAFPLTPNGKVDRKALPAPDAGHNETGEAFAPPRTDLEQRIARVWKEVLHLDQAGIESNFFDLGGYSLLILQLHSRLSAALEREITLMDLFQYPTIKAFAEHLDGKPVAASWQVDEVVDRGRKQRQAMRRMAQTRGGREQS